MGFWNDNIKQSETASAPLPVGPYYAEVTVARAKETKQVPPKKMFEACFKVLAGPSAGRTVWRNFVVSPESPAAMARFFKDMDTLNVPRAYFASEPSDEQIAQRMVGVKVQIDVNHREWNGEVRNDISKVSPLPAGVQLPANGAAPPSMSAAPQPAPAPAAPAVPAPTPAPIPVPAPAPVPQPAPTPEPLAPAGQKALEQAQAELAAAGVQVPAPAPAPAPAPEPDFGDEPF